MVDSLQVGYGSRRRPYEIAAGGSAVGRPRRGVCRNGQERRRVVGRGGGGGGGGMTSISLRPFFTATTKVRPCASSSRLSFLLLVTSSPLLLLLLLLLLLGEAPLQIAADDRGCGLDEFLTAYRDPDVAYYELNCIIALNQSLPPLSKSGKSFTLVGGGMLSMIDGGSKFAGIVLPANHSLILDGLIFVNFRSSSDGSVLSASSSGHVLIATCVFANNTVTNDKNGGALHFSGTVSYLIRASEFMNNRASGNGGSISSSSSSSSPSPSSSPSSSSLSAGYGDGDITGHILGCTFILNSAGNTGGVGSFSDDLRHIKLEGNSFLLNRAGRGGGGVLSFLGGVNTIVSRNLFSANLAMSSSGGGAIRFLAVADVAKDGGGGHSVFTLCANTYSADVSRMKGRLWFTLSNLYVTSDGKDASGVNITFCPRRPDYTVINAPDVNVENSCATCPMPSSSHVSSAHQASKTDTWTALL
ncbi:hypothetical protein CBR_g7962 [Chara braunii]|uniref:Right handed beta helix domain-containing protein n=1 Tax=Chara braunii TaxID=69332 RepID=A0A388KKT2_CHABU|nr:hypothetical protein CBR_g7962 [Chara braunii]|eukprot:GBG70661.1 hypothetical protein CBR_g7962 [Chara braunii]